MVIKWRVQWEIHISLESSYHKEDVKYQTMMWTIMLNLQFRTYWILLSTRLSNIPFFLVQLCVRCSWINLLSSFSSLYLIITRVTYVLVHQLMFWVILFLSFFFFGSKFLGNRFYMYANLRNLSKSIFSSFFLVFVFQIQWAFCLTCSIW